MMVDVGGIVVVVGSTVLVAVAVASSVDVTDGVIWVGVGDKTVGLGTGVNVADSD